ncbi:pyrroline-5-carboxylate reductase [Chloroflexota bacterium]
MKTAFIGGGNMGEAMLAAILEKGLSVPQDILVSDVIEARRQYLKQRYSVIVLSNNLGALPTGDVIVLAIKPQNLVGVMAELSGRLKPTQLVLSIIAGAKIDTLHRGLKHGCIVRAMPNTPAQIGEGMSVWTATAEVTEEQRAGAGSIIGAMGKEIYVDNEKYIDMATAVSGSGPAYVFLFMESLVDAAVDIGLPRDMAQKLVLQTIVGAGHFVQKSGKELDELRRMVTSPGGTTAEALLQFEEGKLLETVKQAVEAAYNKARELGK